MSNPYGGRSLQAAIDDFGQLGLISDEMTEYLEMLIPYAEYFISPTNSDKISMAGLREKLTVKEIHWAYKHVFRKGETEVQWVEYAQALARELLEVGKGGEDDGI